MIARLGRAGILRRRLFAKHPHVTVDWLDHTAAPQVHRAISKPVDGSLRRDVVDPIARQADVDQLPVAQVGQEALALAPRLKRTPISLEQA